MSRSFRDPGGYVELKVDRVVRHVGNEAWTEVEGLLALPAAIQCQEEGLLVRADRESGTGTCLRHPRIPFISYPYEWTPEMLRSAGLLHIQIARRLSSAGYGLKDASAYNVLFEGPRPVFVDWLSMERRNPRDPTWMPYGQFVRHFLLPLLAGSTLGTRLADIFLTRRDGLEPVELYGWCGWHHLLRPAFLQHVTLPRMLSADGWQSEGKVYEPQLCREADQAAYILDRLWRRLEKALRGRAQRGASTAANWSGYMEGGHNYSGAELRAKTEFVERVVAEARPSWVLDAGCNTGHFSRVAAKAGARNIVAADADEAVAGKVWSMAAEERLPVLPLVVNLARPTPATGWRNSEGLSFLDRARGTFDLVMMLALIHHLAVQERAPLAEIIDLAADLSRDHLIIEFVGPEDSQFQRLLRGRGRLMEHYSQDSFEAELKRRFRVVERKVVREGQRILYWARRTAE